MRTDGTAAREYTLGRRAIAAPGCQRAMRWRGTCVTCPTGSKRRGTMSDAWVGRSRLFVMNAPAWSSDDE